MIALNRHGKNTAIIVEIGKKIGLSDNQLESFIQSPILDMELTSYRDLLMKEKWAAEMLAEMLADDLREKTECLWKQK
ncbi:MAG: hypothetical protein ACTHJ2_09475 [Candidatus Nitrosocosmicus sp.]